MNINYHKNIIILTFRMNYDIIETGDIMKLDIIEFDRLPELAKSLRQAIDSQVKRVPISSDNDEYLSWEELVSYLGETFDIINNRQRALGKDGFTKTINNILREGRVDILRKALKEYNPKLYGDF